MPSSHLITVTTFEKLLTRLAPDREQAAHEYETLRRRLIKYFELKGLKASDKAADETLDRIAVKLEAGEVVRDIINYTYGVAQWIFKEQYRAEERERKAFDNLTHIKALIDSHSKESFLQLLEHCLEALAVEDRDLLRLYYTDEDTAARAKYRLELAQNKGLTLNSLRLRVFKLRQSLENCVQHAS